MWAKANRLLRWEQEARAKEVQVQEEEEEEEEEEEMGVCGRARKRHHARRPQEQEV